MATTLARSMGRHVAVLCAVAVTSGLTPAFVVGALTIARAARHVLGRG